MGVALGAREPPSPDGPPSSLGLPQPCPMAGKAQPQPQPHPPCLKVGVVVCFPISACTFLGTARSSG